MHISQASEIIVVWVGAPYLQDTALSTIRAMAQGGRVPTNVPPSATLAPVTTATVPFSVIDDLLENARVTV